MFKNTVVRFLIVLFIIIGALWFGQYAKDNTIILGWVGRFGYIGIFLISVLSGFNLAVPIPAVSFLPLFIESGLSLWLSIFVITVGMTVGDIFGFYIGRVGKDLSESIHEHTIVKRLVKLSKKHPIAPLFVLFLYAGFVPLPNELIVIPLGFLGYRLRYTLPALFMGNILFNLLTGFSIINISKLL